MLYLYKLQDNDELLAEDVGVLEYTVEELLISCVQARPPVWDCRLPLSDRSKTARDKLWLEIFNEFGENPEFSIGFLQKRWRKLRDTYVTPSGSAAKKRKKWECFDLLSFLNDTIGFKRTVSNVRTSEPSTSSSTSSPTPKTLPNSASVAGTQTKDAKIEKSQDVEGAILEVLAKINSSPNSEIPETNPICMRISDILYKMPEQQRTLLEIKLLQMAYEDAKHFL